MVLHVVPDATATTEKEQKEYLKKREATIYQQCKYCGCDGIAAHQQNIEEHEEYLTRKENDLLDPLGLDTSYTPTQHDKHDPARATVLHSMTCQRTELKAAREMGNDHIEDILEHLMETADRHREQQTTTAIIQTPDLHTYLFDHLRKTELQPYLTAHPTERYKRCNLTTRTNNETMLTLDQWTQKCEGNPNSHLICDSLNRWPHTIQLGIVKPESIQPIPLHRACILDTYGIG